jgi:hypothetical protein
MLGRIFRVLSGFVLACLAAGLTKVLFAYSPAEMMNLPPEIASDRLSLALPIATHAAIFAAPFALVAIAIAEWQRWRDWAYYAAAAIAISMIGFAAQYSNEANTQTWSVYNNYTMIAFLTTGFIAGLTYWLFSGRLAGVDGVVTATADKSAVITKTGNNGARQRA